MSFQFHSMDLDLILTSSQKSKGLNYTGRSLRSAWGRVNCIVVGLVTETRHLREFQT